MPWAFHGVKLHEVMSLIIMAVFLHGCCLVGLAVGGGGVGLVAQYVGGVVGLTVGGNVHRIRMARHSQAIAVASFFLAMMKQILNDIYMWR